MLGFWIIVTHLVGAYLSTSEYIQDRSTTSTTFSAIAAVLYMIPFILFLPASPLSFLAVLVFRFIAIRFSLIDHVIWVRNLLAPRDKRSDTAIMEGDVPIDSRSIGQIIARHAGSVAIHGIVIGIALIVL